MDDIETYDAVISLGGLCAVACQLRRRGLSQCALGLDWVGGLTDGCIKYLCEGVRTGFSDFALKRNLIWSFDKENHAGYFDRHSKIWLCHTFRTPNAEGDWYEKDIDKLRSRLNRLMTVASSAKSILFVMACRFEHDLEVTEELLVTLKEVFPQARVKLCEIQFCSKQGPFGVNLGSGDLSVYRYERRDDDRYDIRQTSYEWAFLDKVRLSNPFHRGNAWLNRFLCDIWKRLAKFLYRRGVGMSTDFLYVHEV